jgi:peptidoglycan/xylan/chitin deacetylase (PgdA/CDA1 family)
LKYEAPPGRLRALQWCWLQVQRGRHATHPVARFVRPPYGHETIAARCVTAAFGARMVGWSLTAGDYRGATGSEIANQIVSRLRPGSIVLLHDWLAGAEDLQFLDRTPTLEAVEQLLQLSDYRFVTITELLELGQPRLRFVPQRTTNELAALHMQSNGDGVQLG